MKTLLIVLTLVELVLLVAVLSVYLVVIARTLRNIARTLGLVTFGVRAIEKQTEPLGELLTEINAGLQQVASALEDAVGDSTSPAPEKQIQSPEMSS